MGQMSSSCFGLGRIIMILEGKVKLPRKTGNQILTVLLIKPSLLACFKCTRLVWRCQGHNNMPSGIEVNCD